MSKRRIRIIHLNTWAQQLEPAADYLARQPGRDLRPGISNPNDPELLRMAQLDSDWHSENLRAFAAMQHPDAEFLPALVTGPAGMPDMAFQTIPTGEEWWFIPMAQHPQGLAGVIGRLLEIFTGRGGRTLFWAFDEASRTMTCFPEIAPFLHIYIHDEVLGEKEKKLLRPGCREIHRSWVANIIPFAFPFNEEPEEKILFLGSKLGLTPNRQRQIEILKNHFGEKFHAIHDHSFPVGDRGKLTHFKVSLCPEGRKFSTPGMRYTHTDRPFWSGCLGLVPLIEDSELGGRLQDLCDQKLVIRYKHADADSLVAACEAALAVPTPDRKKIYDHFNKHETIGPIAAQAIIDAAPLYK